MHHNVPTSAGTILNGSLYVGACTCFPGSLLEILWSVSYFHHKLCAVLPVFITNIICSTETFKVTVHALIFRIELKVHTLICQYGWVVHKYLVTIIPTIWSLHVLLAGTCNLNIQNIIIINVLHCGPALEVPTVNTPYIYLWGLNVHHSPSHGWCCLMLLTVNTATADMTMLPQCFDWPTFNIILIHCLSLRGHSSEWLSFIHMISIWVVARFSCLRMVLTFMCCSSSNRSTKTFKPKKNIPEGSHQYDLMKHAAATLGSGNLRLAVSLPDGEDLNEWVAVNSKYM